MPVPDRPRLKILSTGADDSGMTGIGEMPPLLQVHVPKCAGLALDAMMMVVSKISGRPGYRFRGTIYGQGFSGLEKGEAWKEAEDYDFPGNLLYASGHIPFGCFPPCAADPNLVSMVRDPVSRLASMFRMGVRRRAWDAGTPVNELFDSGLLVANSMVRQLSGETSGREELDSRHVEAALRNFEGMKYRGRIEDFDLVIGSILADYKISHVAYHRYHISKSVDDFDLERFAAALAPYIELDQALFDRTQGISRINSGTKEVSVGDLAPSAPVLVMSPYLVSQYGAQTGSAVMAAESLAQIFNC